MKILYAIQGTGNGHITAAREVLPFLKQRAEVDILVSGTQVDISLDHKIKYRLHGMSFIFGKDGGIDYMETYKKSRIKQLFKEIENLPVEEYDLVISDFEPVSAWACYLKNKPCIGFSHQAAVINKNTPQPKKTDLIATALLKYYAPASHRYGFHYLSYDKNIFTPIIRNEIRNQLISNEGHYTVYLPSYSDKKIIRLLASFPETEWEVFCKHAEKDYQEGNIAIRKIDNEQFIQSLASSNGLLCNAGFQATAEALFMKKKLLIVPMKGQYEQRCNAVALKMLGVPVIKNLKPKNYLVIKEWLESTAVVTLDFPDDTQKIVAQLIHDHAIIQHPLKKTIKEVDSPSSFRKLILNKIIYNPA